MTSINSECEYTNRENMYAKDGEDKELINEATS